jgi:hypothetical protein
MSVFTPKNEDKPSDADTKPAEPAVNPDPKTPEA